MDRHQRINSRPRRINSQPRRKSMTAHHRHSVAPATTVTTTSRLWRVATKLTVLVTVFLSCMDVAPLILPMALARLGLAVRLLGVRCAPYPDIHVSNAPSPLRNSISCFLMPPECSAGYCTTVPSLSMRGSTLNELNVCRLCRSRSLS